MLRGLTATKARVQFGLLRDGNEPTVVCSLSFDFTSTGVFNLSSCRPLPQNSALWICTICIKLFHAFVDYKHNGID